jgi:hypothetical protein
LEALRKVWVPLFTVTTEDHWIELSWSKPGQCRWGPQEAR